MVAWEDSLTVWMAVSTSLVTIVLGLFGLYHTTQTRRIDRQRRLMPPAGLPAGPGPTIPDAAAVAVRRTEATVVRPLLHQRMITVLESVGPRLDRDPLLFRLHLYCSLLRDMGLREEEKRHAYDVAETHLVTLLESMPGSPVRLRTEDDRNRQAGHLRECIEFAYNLRPRPTAEMVRNLGDFCRGVAGGPSGQENTGQPRPTNNSLVVPE